MKIVCISDMHRMYDKIIMPYGDVLVVAGDMLGAGTLWELNNFAQWLDNLRVFDHKIVVAGNHDIICQDSPESVNVLLELDNTHYLQDSSVIIDGIKFYGSPWVPQFYDWAFMLPRNGPEIKAKWAAIPDDTDVLITHGPPHGILDRVGEGLPCGCELLFERVMKVKPKLHIFGHIHASAGEKVFLDTHYVNAAICTERYKPLNKPIVVEI